jgi:hypothetical protein
MKMLAYLLAIICIIAAVMYAVMPAESLPTFMPGYQAHSDHSQDARRCRRCGRCCSVRDRLAYRPRPPLKAISASRHA